MQMPPSLHVTFPAATSYLTAPLHEPCTLLNGAIGWPGVQVASVCIAMWDGLVHTRIVRLLQCDLVDTLKKSYAAVWESIRS